MKKTLLSLGLILVSVVSNAQSIDTLNAHFTGTRTLYSVGAANGGGFVTGNNGYGDLTKMVLFDGTSGTVTGPGTVTGVLLDVPVKRDAGGTFQVIIVGDNAGTPLTTPLASATINLAAVDTAVTGYALIAPDDVYNVAVNFTTAATIPANNAFWVVVVLPNTAGDTLALASNTAGDVTNASTHVAEYWSDLTFHTFGDPANWNLQITMPIFPIVQYTASLDENVVTASVSPNPTSDLLNINIQNESIETIVVSTLDGKSVLNSNSSNLDVSGLNAGLYIYTATTSTGKIAKGNFVKK